MSNTVQAKADPTEEAMVDDPLDASNIPDDGNSELAAYEREVAQILENEPLDDEQDNSAPESDEDSEEQATPEEDEFEEQSENEDGEENEESPEEDAQEGEESKAPDRFRIRAKDAIEAEALALRKRHPDLSLKDCIAKAELILGVKTVETESTSRTEESQGPTSSDLDTQIKELRARRKEATVDMEFETAADLDDQIDELRDKRDALKVSEQQAKADADANGQRAFEAEYSKYERIAVSAYPDLKDADSEQVQLMVQLDKAMLANEDPLYHSPQKALILAKKAAIQLGIPMATPGVTTPAKPRSQRSPIQPAAGNRGTTATAPTIKLDDAIGKLNSLEDYEAFVGLG